MKIKSKSRASTAFGKGAGIAFLCIAGAVLAAALATGCATDHGVSDLDATAPHAATAPAAPDLAAHPAVAPPTTQAADPAWPVISKILERPGVLKDGVYVITVPRDDLDVTIDHMGIPTAAGLESVFYFYRCPCGKMNVVGQFVACDYEADDIVDALRKDAIMKVPAIAPLLLYENPRLLLVRFQGEGDPAALAGVMREAIRWTGHERMAPDPANLPQKSEK
jgi:Domain of Unknown Function (DUF1259)